MPRDGRRPTLSLEQVILRPVSWVRDKGVGTLPSPSSEPLTLRSDRLDGPLWRARTGGRTVRSSSARKIAWGETPSEVRKT